MVAVGFKPRSWCQRAPNPSIGAMRSVATVEMLDFQTLNTTSDICAIDFKRRSATHGIYEYRSRGIHPTWVKTHGYQSWGRCATDRNRQNTLIIRLTSYAFACLAYFAVGTGVFTPNGGPFLPQISFISGY
jgi:hypothetical protein